MTMNMRWFALGAAAIALGACSDTTTSPLPRGIAAGSGPSLSATLNGQLLGSQAMVDCNTNPNTLPCHWTVAGALHVTAPAADFNAPGVENTLTFLVVDLATGFPSTVAGVGGTAPQWACGTRPFQA